MAHYLGGDTAYDLLSRGLRDVSGDGEKESKKQHTEDETRRKASVRTDVDAGIQGERTFRSDASGYENGTVFRVHRCLRYR